jgi:hypothetical protein
VAKASGKAATPRAARSNGAANSTAKRAPRKAA